MFDAEIVVTVNLGSPTGTSGDKSHPFSSATTHLRLCEDATHHRWHVSGKHDARFPGTGPAWLKYKRNPQTPGNIILFNKYNHAWAELEDFPVSPTVNSKGSAFLTNINYPPCKYTDGRWIGDWYVNQRAKQRNLPLFDPGESYMLQAVHSCTTDTGFRFDTSSGAGISGGAIVGAGAGQTNIVLMRKEPSDSRRWDLTIRYAGVGLMTPGVGVSGSIEAMPSGGFSNVLAGPGMRLPVHPDDFAGSVVFFDVGASVGAGEGVAVGAGGSTTSFLFLGGVYNDGMIPDFTTAKALLQTWGSSVGVSRSSTPFSAGASGLLYGGVCSVRQR